MKVLDDQGVKKIESVGQPFNVEFHEALMQKKSDDVPPHTVLNEVEKGYIYKDRVIKHAKVIVSEDTAENTPDSEDTNNEFTEE
jgi:molecular chaperone GrpE